MDAHKHALASGLRFEGEGPFYLRTIEHAKASALDDTIQLTLYAIADTNRGLVQIETQMTFGAAEELASTLNLAIRGVIPTLGS